VIVSQDHEDEGRGGGWRRELGFDLGLALPPGVHTSALIKTGDITVGPTNELP
jgi:hypothetical protein